MKTQPLSLDLIVIDAGTQSRLAIDEDTVDDYAEIIRATPQGEWPFPPLDVFHDGSAYYLADGFHRDLGALRAKRASAPCVVHQGTALDALVFGMTANDKHGLRRNRADKRFNVELLLDKGGKMTQKEVAEKAGVGITLVKKIVSERNPASIAGKAAPPKQEGEGRNDPSTPSGGGNIAPSPPVSPPPPIVAKTGRAAEIWNAQQVMKTWVDAIGRWMNGNPAGIDSYREVFPGPLGDKAIDAARALLNALDAWRKGLK